ncbi:MAG: hypothetical protein CME80_02250 [Halomonas sp.]|nr:hypothetical protein [Halomonas sp.]MBF56538.1 hypothetical protein [Halomonas sp.]|tara:strand:- start:16630 stop:17235 length:606 start_codon:yes stop_codon:yes gene_type:complete
MNTISHESKSDVLHAFSVESNPNAETLKRYLKLYPQFRESLIDLSIELFSAPSFDEVLSEPVNSDNAQKAWSNFQTMLSQNDPASEASIREENPLQSLTKERFLQLVGELNVNRLFLRRLRDNTIHVATIPRQFLALLAERLNVSVERLQRDLDAPPTTASGVRYKADGKPSAGDKITFEDALSNSHLSVKQQSALRSMKD